MGHPTEGVLRRLLDEPGAVAVSEREHVGECEECLAALDRVRADAEAVSLLMSTGPLAVNVEAGWQRLSVSRGPRRSRLRDALRSPVVAGAAVAVVLAGAGTAAANNWLPIFQAEQVAPVSITTADLNALPDLEAYGDVRVIAEPGVHPVADAAAAEAESGLDVPEIRELPRGVTGEPRYRVGGEAVLEFTFSAERAARTAAAAGEELPPPPRGLDGSKVRLVAGPGVAMTWSKAGGIPVLVVGRAAAPKALSSSGLPFETVREYLLSLPGLPEGIASPLRTFNAGGSTLPLPVPADYVTTSEAEIAGNPASVLVTRDKSTAAVVWVDEGVMTVVAGTLDADEVLALARGMR